MSRAQIVDPRWALDYVLAGRGKFTVVSVKTGTRFTYQIQSPQTDNPAYNRPPSQGSLPAPPLFVKVLAEGSEGFLFIGFIRGPMFKHSTKAKVSQEAPSFQAFSWLYRMLLVGKLPEDKIEFWHEGKCGKCGRALTVPESIQRGLGPICLRGK